MLNNSRDLDGSSDKKNPQDFALWKKADKSHIMNWESPWGNGFPGWHLECTSMSKKYLGDRFDIHGGGIDLKFPHHDCEIAQSEAIDGNNPANFWMHANMLTLNGKRCPNLQIILFFQVKFLMEKIKFLANPLIQMF